MTSREEQVSATLTACYGAFRTKLGAASVTDVIDPMRVHAARKCPGIF